MKRRDDLVVGPKEKAKEAINAGNTEEALDYLDKVYEQFHNLHDSYGNTQCLLMGKLAEIIYHCLKAGKLYQYQNRYKATRTCDTRDHEGDRLSGLEPKGEHFALR